MAVVAATAAGTRGGAGSGVVVVVRYQIGQKLSQKATGGAITPNGKTIHAFENSGLYLSLTPFNECRVFYKSLVVAVVVWDNAGGGGGAGGLLDWFNQ